MRTSGIGQNSLFWTSLYLPTLWNYRDTAQDGTSQGFRRKVPTSMWSMIFDSTSWTCPTLPARCWWEPMTSPPGPRICGLAKTPCGLSGVGTFRALNTPLSRAERQPVHHSPASATVAEYGILVRSSEPAHGHLFDLSGRSVWKGNLLPGTNRIQKRLSPGIYQLELRFSGGDRKIIPILRP